ncbi:MAG: hypothetical protein ACI9TH_001818 [Kiritimatiellia bacterium]|jgi:hypothetical protein
MMKRALFSALLAVLPTYAQAADPAPFPYVEAKAFHMLPETHNEESGYFSLCEARDGRVYVGTAKYGENAFLVEFDPVTEQQRVVVDARKLCGLNATGYAAQAKFHTRNFVGPSGKMYLGTKQGYAEKGDTSTYAGGYFVVYDPRSGEAQNRGMPFPGQGIADVVADEARGLAYIVTCEDQHWMRHNLGNGDYHEIGPMLTPYATTLIDGRGRANAITEDFKLAQFDPQSGMVRTRPIMVGNEVFTRPNGAAIPTWNLATDGRTAYLILMNDPTLLVVDLFSEGEVVEAKSCGKMIEGKQPDSRCALTIAPDGRIYTLVSVNNETGFGEGKLHHLLRYDPTKNKSEDLGVLAVTNPDFFEFGPGPDGKKPAWSHGFHTLPDGRMTPLHHHMALLAGQDGTLYATILYPFTLLKIEGFKIPAPPASPAETFLQELEKKVDAVESQLPEITRVAEICAERYAQGGIMGVPWMGSTLEQELFGRSGGIIHFGFDRPPQAEKERNPEDVKQDMVVMAWDEAPRGDEGKRIADYRAKGIYVLGFGAKKHPEIAKMVPLCDAWMDTGNGATDRLLDGPGQRLGKSNHIVNALLGWCFTAEFVSAHTRKGRMPPMWKSWETEGGKAWSEKYFRKDRFHADLQVPAIPPGALGKQYLEQMRSHLRAFGRNQLPAVARAAEMIVTEVKEGGSPVVVASSGHMAMNYIGKYDDKKWARNIEVHHNVDAQLKRYREHAPDGGLTLRLGYMGLHENVQKVFDEKKSRVLLIAAEHPGAQFAFAETYPDFIDMGYAYGDACVSIEGYPIRLFPASGVMQAVAYECVNVDVLTAMKP